MDGSSNVKRLPIDTKDNYGASIWCWRDDNAKCIMLLATLYFKP